MSGNETIWECPPVIATTANEATVELMLVLPLLEALGYCRDDIASKHPIRIQDGRGITIKYADFVVFDGASREEGNALFVIEAKRPSEPLGPARGQGESYATRLRALVYVVTNGQALEVWQYRRTGSSELVVTCQLADLAASRADLEAHLGLESLKAYRAQIREPNLREVAWDLSAYENVELARLATSYPAVNRTLLRTEFPSHESKPFSVDEHFALEPLTVIYAPSGMGKSWLCVRMCQLALTRRRLLIDAPIPVFLSLPDAAAAGAGVRMFAYERIAAHCPQFTQTMFREVLRTSGLDLYCDAFDRVQDAQRLQVETEFGILLRDSPRTRVTLFSRRSTPPQLSALTYYLQPLDRAQQDALEDTVWRAKAEMPRQRRAVVASLLPEFFKEIAGSPLIFSKLVEFYAENEELPTNLAELFRFWLAEVLRHRHHKPTAYAALVSALTAISLETWDGAASALDVIEALRRSALPAELLDRLVELGSVIETDGHFEVEHEALADYLRARATVGDIRQDPAAVIPAVRMGRDTFFPILLAALTTDVNAQRIVLEHLTALGLNGYLNAVRFRGNVAPTIASMTTTDAETHVSQELVDGFMTPARRLFSAVLPDLVFTATGVRSTIVRAAVRLSANSTAIHFSLLGGDNIDGLYQESIVGNDDLVLKGREIGLDALHLSLDKLIKTARLSGGPVWHEERLLSRLRLLLVAQQDVEPSLDVGKQRAYWEQYRGEIFAFVLRYARHEIVVDEILADLEVLSNADIDKVTVWWNADGSEQWWTQDWDESDQALQQYYARTDAAYAELVTSNFREVASDLSTYSLLPRSWDVYFQPRITERRRAWITALWHPVAKATDTRVQIFRHAPADGVTSFSSGWFDETANKLTSLGRRAGDITYVSGIPPSFSGRNLLGRYDGKTAVLRAASQRLREEFQRHFREVTGGSISLNTEE